jgi:predicted ester cyclase
MTMSNTGSDTGADTGTLDREFAVRWYQSWIDAWNSHDPGRVREIVTDDFVLDSPTTRHTDWFVKGPQGASDYVRYVLDAYPDLVWEVTAPPLFCDGIARAAFSWRGTGHFSGTLAPPGIPGTGKPFVFTGLEVFDFHGDRACYLYACYDLIGLMKQIGVYRSASAEGTTR